MTAAESWSELGKEWWREAAAVFVKEAKTEWRTRVALSATALFTACSLTLIAMAVRDKDAASVEPQVAAGLVWVVLMFTASVGLGRGFVQEEERGTALVLRLTARATTVWAGKFAGNAALLLALSWVAGPVLLAMVAVPIANPLLLFCVLTLGSIGTAAVFTTTGALVAQASAKGGLLPVLSFPLLVPLLLAGVHGTKVAVGVGAIPGQAVRFSAGLGDLQVLFSYLVVGITASLLLFEYLWND